MNFKEEEYTLTNNIYEAIFIDKYGNMMDGEFDMGMRGIDHNCIIPYYNDNRTHEQKWNDIHSQGVIRLVPETKIALINVGQKLNDIQKQLLSNTDYIIEEY